MHGARMWVLTLVIGGAAACGESEQPEEMPAPGRPPGEPFVHVDSGSICVRSTDNRVIIDFSQCVDEECVEVVGVACTAAVLGGNINVHSEVRVEPNPNSNGCFGGCQIARSRCTVEIEEPAYVLQYAGQRGFLQVPVPQGWALGFDPTFECGVTGIQPDAGL